MAGGLQSPSQPPIRDWGRGIVSCHLPLAPSPKVLSATTLILVGTPGFEPGTSCAQGRHANQAAPRPDYWLSTLREVGPPTPVGQARGWLAAPPRPPPAPT